MLENDNNIEVDLDRLRKAVAKLRPTRRKIMNLLKVHFSLWDEVEDIWWDLMFLEDEIDSLLDGREPTRHRERATRPSTRISTE
jgi:hypothetical protein